MKPEWGSLTKDSGDREVRVPRSSVPHQKEMADGVAFAPPAIGFRFHRGNGASDDEVAGVQFGEKFLHHDGDGAPAMSCQV